MPEQSSELLAPAGNWDCARRRGELHTTIKLETDVHAKWLYGS